MEGIIVLTDLTGVALDHHTHSALDTISLHYSLSPYQTHPMLF